MKHPVNKIIFCVVTILLISAVIFCCSYPDEYVPAGMPQENEIFGIEIITQNQNLVEKESVRACVRIIFVSGMKGDSNGKKIDWASSDQNIITVDSDGFVTGIRSGGAVLSAWMDNFEARLEITVARAADCSKIFISEVFYDPLGKESDFEFIEIFNDSSDECPISGYSFADGNPGSSPFVFPEGTAIRPGEFITLASSRDGFYSLFGKYPLFSGFSFSLNNSGETVIFTRKDGSRQDILYIEGGIGVYITPPEWGSSTLPSAREGESVRRTDFVQENSYRLWSSGPPTPGEF